MALHVIVGKGPVGTTTARNWSPAATGAGALAQRRGLRRRDRARRGGRHGRRRRQRLPRGADAIYNAANPAYHRWVTDWPPIAAALLAAAERTGAVLVTMGNLYGYGRPTGPMTPDSPLAATDVKGRVRARMWADALAAHDAGRVRVTEARAADFVGPRCRPTSPTSSRQLATVRQGRRAWVVGDPDACAAGRTCPTSRPPWRRWVPTSGPSGTPGTCRAPTGRSARRSAISPPRWAAAPRVSTLPWPVLSGPGRRRSLPARGRGASGTSSTRNSSATRARPPRPSVCGPRPGPRS